MTKKKIHASRGTVAVANPVAPLMRNAQFRKRVAKSGEDREEQRDPWSKKAKHKSKPLDEALVFESFQVGDKVIVSDDALQRVLDRADELLKSKEKVEAIVKNPNGPDGSIGINLDGEYYNVDEEEISLVMENITEPDLDNYDDITEWAMIQTTSGIAIQANGEEVELLNKFDSRMYNDDFDEREQEVARKMVSRGLLNRRKDDRGIFFLKTDDDLGRF